MPRGSFKHEDSSQGGFGFQEGNALITKSVVAVHQFPPNSKTNEQSDAFTAMRWTLKKLDADWNELGGEDTDSTVVLPVRLGTLDQMRPGKLSIKDFDNLDVEPEDLGEDVDTEGNALFIVDNAKPSRSWAILEESLRKCGFKPEISGRGVASDFDGMMCHFKTVEGAKYIAKQGAKKGQEVTPTNLVVDRIHTYPYDKKKGSTTTSAKTGGGGKTTTASTTSTASISASNNGDATTLAAAVQVFSKLSKLFHDKVPKDKDVARTDFQKALAAELMRQKLDTRTQKNIMEFVKSDDGVVDLANELVDQAGAFSTDGSTVNFS